MCANESDRPSWTDEEIERPRGVLTKSDRELLGGFADELSDRAKEQRMVRLRRRVRNGLMDASQLMQLEPSDRQLIFEPRDEGTKRNVEGGAIMLIQFLYMGLKGTEHDAQQTFMNAIESAEKRLGEEQGEYRNPRVHLSVNLGDTFDLEEIREKLDNEEYMNHQEVVVAMRRLDLSDDDWEKLRRINDQAVDRELDKISIGGTFGPILEDN